MLQLGGQISNSSASVLIGPACVAHPTLTAPFAAKGLVLSSKCPFNVQPKPSLALALRIVWYVSRLLLFGLDKQGQKGG